MAAGRVMSLPKVLYAGSFDPVTNGHLDIIRRAQKWAGELTVLVMQNEAKRPLFSLEERVALLREAVNDERVRVESGSGLTAHYAAAHQIQVLVRGVRGAADCEDEQRQAHYNRCLAPQIETVWLPCRTELQFVSSSAVRELWLAGADVSSLVPPCVVRALAAKKQTDL